MTIPAEKMQPIKDWMGRYLIARKEQENALLALERWRKAAQRTGWALDGEQTETSGQTNPLQLAAAEELWRLQSELAEKISQCIGIRREIVAAIDQMREGKLRSLLWYRYIEGLTFERIAERMHYSCMHIYRLHKRALNELILPSAASPQLLKEKEQQAFPPLRRC